MLFISLLPCFLYLVIAQPDDPIVATALGRFRGTVMESRNGNQFFAFRGIRYAEPPMGELRFRAPIPIRPHDTIYDATNDGPICPQPSNIPTSEDCLWLNVYTKKLSRFSRHPVLVFIHGGSFFIGSGASWLFGPQPLMDRDGIVLVTINYRLGAFGFLSTGTKECPGNNGFKDQVVALRWIKEHIINFGGNPDTVTIMGQNAGAISVSLLTVSPMAQGLFHRVILMSGSATGQLKLGRHQAYHAKQLAKFFKCPTNTTQTIVECLRRVPEHYLANSFDVLQEFSFFPLMIWRPVIETDFGQERFLIESPLRTMKKGNFHKVRVLAGVTSTELPNLALGILTNDVYREEMEDNWNQVAPITFMYERVTERSRNISHTLRSIFLSGPLRNNDQSLKELETLFSDGIINFGVHRFVHLISNWTEVFYYKQEFSGRFSQFFHPQDQPYGTVHGDDLMYLFYVPTVSVLFNDADPENVAVERMTRFWSNFAKNGDPNDLSDPVIGATKWAPFDIELQNYMKLGNNISMEQGLFLERFLIWELLFPLDFS